MTAGRETPECLHLWTHGYAQPCTREPGHDGPCHYNNGWHAHPRTDQPCNPRCVTPPASEVVYRCPAHPDRRTPACRACYPVTLPVREAT